ncbi:MAG: DUF3617 domain-containing protein [Pseudobdellovibrio sp.]
MLRLFLALFFFSGSLYAQSLESGLWKSQDSFEVNGLAMPQSSHENCVTEAQAKDAKSTIEQQLKKQGCSVSKWNVKNNKLDASLSCKNKDIEATGTISGSFSAKVYNLKAEANGTFRQVMPATAVIRLSGQWMKKCPAK